MLFRSCLLNSTANQANFQPNWAEFSLLLCRQILKGSQNILLFMKFKLLFNLLDMKPFVLSIFTSFLKYLFRKNQFNKLDFLSILNQNFTACVVCKNLVQNRQNFRFVELDFQTRYFKNLVEMDRGFVYLGKGGKFPIDQ